MTTICSKCGSVLAADADILFCPQCGTPTSNYSKADISSNEPTAMGTPIQSPSQTSITDYGSNPYGAPLQHSYESLNPYDASLPLPPPPPLPPTRRPKLRILISIVMLVLIIVGVSVGVLLTLQPKNTTTGNTSLPTTTPAQSSIPATGIATAEKNPYALFTGTMVLNDALTDNSKGYGWDEGTVSDGSYCKFIGGTYHDNQADPHYIHPCFALNTDYSNFTYELKMTILKGGCGGLIFMADGANSKYFVFNVCQEGTFSLFYFSGFGQSGTWYSPLSVVR